METKVSVIIPIYNVEKYLKQCLDSVINQTFKDIEIICINDSSTDKSLQIIKEYQQKDNRIILIDLKENKGVSNARNEGLKIAKCKYITFVDPDDWTDKDYVKTLYDNMIKYDYDIIGIGFYIFNKQIKEYKYPKFCYDTDFSLLENKQKLLTLRLIWSLWAKIYKRDFIIKNNIVFESRIMGDITFNYEAILSARNIKFIDKANYFYRVYRTNSITLNKKRFYFYPEIINKIKKIL
ncbi:MAG: glycosyltransferase, partial [Elusimicrobia bacterium]|nr:glycosyltransferase [Elusimicrobiota bacterium]